HIEPHATVSIGEQVTDCWLGRRDAQPLIGREIPALIEQLRDSLPFGALCLTELDHRRSTPHCHCSTTRLGRKAEDTGRSLEQSSKRTWLHETLSGKIVPCPLGEVEHEGWIACCTPAEG